MSRRECETCTDMLPENARPETIHCKKCKGSRRYWRKKRPSQRLQRRKDLDVYANRLDTFFHDDVKGATTVIDARHKFDQTKTAARTHNTVERARRRA